MSVQVYWNLPFPLEDGVLPDDTLVVKSRETSGAGQFEIAGNAPAPDGSLFRARDAIGSRITFVLPSPYSVVTIRVSEEYPVQEVGGKVRVSVQGENESRPNIGNLFAALFFLPEVSSRGKSLPLNEDNLEEKTFWIDDVSCRIVSINSGLLVLEPVCFVFATNNKDDSSQTSKMAIFDYKQRLKELFEVAIKGSRNANGSVKTAFRYYLDVIRGKLRFEYSMGAFLKSSVMSWLERNNSDYRSALDALPFLAHGALDGVPDVKNTNDLGSRNLIYFGAPGTGKSHNLDEAAKAVDGDVRRVTFYPDYTYSQFVGCFKPITEETVDGDGNVTSKITYRYVLGPFLKTYVQAIRHPDQSHLLIIEEINRANPAAVFGDVFQLLDRDKDGNSVYAVDVPEEMQRQLCKELDKDPDEVEALSIPKNMYIWATMNSADQGVFPMDTAFKRRWDFRYIGIDDGEDAVIGGKKLSEYEVPLGGRRVYWNELRRAINRLMVERGRINEDKLLGPFFLNPNALNDERFPDAFKDKVLLYLFEDAGRTKRADLFWQPNVTYSQVCLEFDSSGDHVFGSGFDATGIWADESDSPSADEE